LTVARDERAEKVLDDVDEVSDFRAVDDVPKVRKQQRAGERDRHHRDSQFVKQYFINVFKILNQ